MKKNTFKEKIELIGIILVTAIFNYDPYCLLDERVKGRKRKEENCSEENKYKKK